jgi:hypothetical protein
MIPCREIVRLLELAYPCAGFTDSCSELTWAPARGHVPRGYGGATGTPGDVRLVLVMSQPDPPPSDQTFDADMAPQDLINAICRSTYLGLAAERNQFYRNTRFLLSCCFPGVSLQEQLRLTWITQSVLCSANDGDEIPASASLECRNRFLARQLELFASATVVALGHSAAKRLAGHPNLLQATYPGPPACNHRSARESWNRIGELFARH